MGNQNLSLRGKDWQLHLISSPFLQFGIISVVFISIAAWKEMSIIIYIIVISWVLLFIVGIVISPWIFMSGKSMRDFLPPSGSKEKPLDFIEGEEILTSFPSPKKRKKLKSGK